ncbi:hypothetical protein BDR03DRAFT_971290, partial [Suillus americanus]
MHVETFRFRVPRVTISCCAVTAYSCTRPILVELSNIQIWPSRDDTLSAMLLVHIQSGTTWPCENSICE